MPRIKTELVQEGMVIVTDVKNMDDMLLIPAGCALTEHQIGILKAWGVEEIEVQHSRATEEADPLARLAPEDVARMTADIQGRFWHPDESNPVFVEILGLLLLRRARGHKPAHNP